MKSNSGSSNRFVLVLYRRLINFLVTNFLSLMTSFLFPLRRHGERHKLPAPLVVSLTSYPARFPSLHLTLKCLLSQSVAPDQVILWIAHADKEYLPPNVRTLESSGLTVEFCDDLRSFKKIIPALQKHANSYIVTADDDVYYGPSWLKQLVNTSHANPGDVVCHRAHTIRLGPNNAPLPYNDWILNSRQTDTSPLTFQTGVGGVLYPPHVLHSDILNVGLFMQLCFNADDVWLYWMMRLNNVIARRVVRDFQVYSWSGTQNTALWRSNLLQCNNDAAISKMLHHYGSTIFSSGHD